MNTNGMKNDKKTSGVAGSWIRGFLGRRSWQDVKWFGNNRIVHGCWVWLIITPIAANLLAPVADSLGSEQAAGIATDWINTHVVAHLPKHVPVKIEPISVELPFRWRVFWVAALSALVAQLLYATYCPSLISDYEDYGDYRRRHSGFAEVLPWATQTMKRLSKSRAIILLHQTGFAGAQHGIRTRLDGAATKTERESVAEQFAKRFSGKLETEDRAEQHAFVSDKFSCLRKYAGYELPMAMWSCQVFYAITLLLFGWVIAETVYYTIPRIF